MVKKTFSSITDLSTELNSISRDVQEKTLDELLVVLNEIIREYIYNGKTSFNGEGLVREYYSDGSSDSSYYPTGELLKMFKVQKIYTKKRGDVNQTYGSIVADGGVLSHDKDRFIHDSNYGYSLDPNQLVRILNEGTTDGIFGALAPRPFWDDFLDYANKEYSNIFKRIMKDEHGIDLEGSSRIGTANQYGQGGTIVDYT